MGWNLFARKAAQPDMRLAWLTQMPAPEGSGNEAFAAVFDYMPGEKGVTVCCAIDGAASIYNSDGGGTIGIGASDPRVAAAARAAVAAVQRHAALLLPAQDFPRPPEGSYAFHAVTVTGVRRAVAKAPDVKEEAHPLHGLFLAFHEVVTEVRLLEERKTPVDILLRNDGGLAIRDAGNPKPTWLTLFAATPGAGPPPSGRDADSPFGRRTPIDGRACRAGRDRSGGRQAEPLAAEADYPGGGSSLHVACATPRLDIVADLLERGAKLEAVDKHRYTPLIIACNHGSAEVVEALVAAGAQVTATDEDGNSPLMYAAQSKDARKVRTLVRAGADIGHRGQGGMTALAIPSQYRGNPAREELRSAGAKD